MSDEADRIVTPSPDDINAYGGGTASDVSPAPGDSSEAATRETQEWKDKFLRAKAELSNYQKRAEKDRLDTLRYAVGDFARALLPVIDDLDRVIASGFEPNATLDNLLAGAKLTRDNFLKVLEGFQVFPIKAEGQPFDPHLHEAVMEQPSEHDERTVLKEVARGYQFHDRVLRPARVIVSKPAAEGESDR
jgi:molecular chaperone GrpE